MDSAILTAVLGSAATVMIPVLWASYGEAIGEEAGILNIGVEGVMLVGAFGAAFGLQHTGSLSIAALMAIPSGLICALVLGYLYINRGTNQIVTGILFNLLALGATTALYEQYLTGAGLINTFTPIPLPVLSNIPILGPSIFTQAIPTYAAFLAAPVVYYLLRHTWFGLYLRILGERPDAGESSGLNVQGLRWAAFAIGCVLVAFGGASLVLVQTGGFVADITSGQGFIALAVVILCRWNPLWIVAGAALFGLADALQFQMQTVSQLSSVPRDVWLAVPYVVTIVAVAVARRSQYPAACGVPYVSGAEA
ncbi:MAG TPA: ABC transporter permease [Chloroflexota bacterium]|nr:ABC transporter permease [Chloroflexota bacterium]